MNLLVTLNYESTVPLYKQLYQSICDAIVSGRLKPGDQMPPTRELAKQLNVSRVTVLRCYKALLNRGHFEAGQGLGTRVSRLLPDTERIRHKFLSFAPDDNANLTETSSEFANRLCADYTDTDTDDDVTPRACQTSRLPIRRWQHCVIKTARGLESQLAEAETEDFGYSPLRETMAKLLNFSRGLSCTADQILTCSSRAKAIDLISRLLLNEGDFVAMEDPGDPDVRRIFKAHGAHIHPVAIDEQGLVVSDLDKNAGRIKLIHVTPMRQKPTGSNMSMNKKIELIRWARKNGAIILEDDFDSFFRINGQPPLPSIKSLEVRDSAIYLADLSSMMSPLTETAFLVVPSRFLDKFRSASRFLDRDVRLFDNMVLDEFISSGAFEMHCRKLQDSMRNSRQALTYSLVMNFRNLVTISRNTAASYLLVRFNDEHLSEKSYLECAKKAGIVMRSTGRYYLEKQERREFLIYFSQSEPESLPQQIAEMASLVASLVPDSEEQEFDFSIEERCASETIKQHSETVIDSPQWTVPA